MRIRMPPGLGLLETTIAIAVIVTGLFAAFTLVFANRRASEEASLRFGATQLAREGIEAVRLMRDSNWLAGRAWDAGIAGENADYTGVPVFDTTTGSWSMIYQANDLASPLARVVRRSPSPFLIQGVTAGVDVTATAYRRGVTLFPICSDDSVIQGGLTCAPDASPPVPKVGILVRSIVQWHARGTTHEITAEERLYDWR